MPPPWKWDPSAFFEGVVLAAQQALPDLNVGQLRRDARVLSRYAGQSDPQKFVIGLEVVEKWFEYRRRRPAGSLSKGVVISGHRLREFMRPRESTPALEGWTSAADKVKDPAFTDVIAGAQTALKCLKPDMPDQARHLQVLPELYLSLVEGPYRKCGVSRENAPLLFAAGLIDFQLTHAKGFAAPRLSLNAFISPDGPLYGTVSVDSDPTEAELWIDGREFGKTPLGRVVMQARTPHVFAARRGASKAKEEKTLNPGENRPIKLVLGYWPGLFP